MRRCHKSEEFEDPIEPMPVWGDDDLDEEGCVEEEEEGGHPHLQVL